MPQSSVSATLPSNSVPLSRDCLAHRFGNTGGRPHRRPRYPSDMSDAEWAVVRDAMPLPAWLEGRGGQPEGYCHRQLAPARPRPGREPLAEPAPHPPRTGIGPALPAALPRRDHRGTRVDRRPARRHPRHQPPSPRAARPAARGPRRPRQQRAVHLPQPRRAHLLPAAAGPPTTSACTAPEPGTSTTPASATSNSSTRASNCPTTPDGCSTPTPASRAPPPRSGSSSSAASPPQLRLTVPYGRRPARHRPRHNRRRSPDLSWRGPGRTLGVGRADPLSRGHASGGLPRETPRGCVRRTVGGAGQLALHGVLADIPAKDSTGGPVPPGGGAAHGRSCSGRPLRCRPARHEVSCTRLTTPARARSEPSDG